MGSTPLEKAVRKALSFGTQDQIRKKNKRQEVVAIFGAVVAAVGFAGLALNSAYLIFGSLLGYVTTVEWTPWVAYSFKLTVTGLGLFFLTGFLPKYFPLAEARAMSDGAAGLIRDCPDVRVFRDRVVASGRELCGRDYALMEKIYAHYVTTESERRWEARRDKQGKQLNSIDE